MFVLSGVGVEFLFYVCWVMVVVVDVEVVMYILLEIGGRFWFVCVGMFVGLRLVDELVWLRFVYFDCDVCL